MKLLQKDTLSTKLVPVCEFLALFSIPWEQNTLPLTKNTTNVFLGKQCYHKHFLFIFYQM